MGKFSNLQAFGAVAEFGSFSEAARKLNLSRAQISKSVMKLEDELGVQLLNRTTRKVSLTPIGEDYYLRSSRILADLEEANRLVSERTEDLNGIFRLNAPLSFGVSHLGPALVNFMSKHPGLKVELTLNDRFVDLVEEGYDATIRIGPLSDSLSIVDHPVSRIELGLYASPDYLRKNRPIKKIDQLKDLPCLYYGTNSGKESWQLARNDEQTQTIKIRPVLSSNNGDVLRSAAEKGFGIVMLPSFIAEKSVQEGKLMRVLEKYSGPETHLMVLYAPNRHLSPKIRKFLEFMYDTFSDKSW